MVESTFADVTFAAAGDVGRRDVDVMRRAAAGTNGVEQGKRTVQVGCEAFVDGRVEGDLAGAVHDEVDVARQLGDVWQVPLEHGDPGADERIHGRVTVAGAQSLERGL